MSPRPTDPAVRFERYVDRSAGPDACWGYGQFSLTSDRSTCAHRFAWCLANGPIPDGLFVCHHCDNPSCVNPGHLFVGTPSDNMRDAAAKGRLALQMPGRISRARGEQHHNSKLTDRDVREIRRLAAMKIRQRDIAARFGITQPAVGYIVRRQHWSHV